MLPITHFIAGAFLGVVGARAGVIDYWHIFWVGFAAMLPDIDHVASYIYHGEGGIIKYWNNNLRGKENRYGRTFIHHKKGFVLITPILVAVYVINPVWGFTLLAAYLSHYLLDHIHLRFLHLERLHTVTVPEIVVPWSIIDVILTVALAALSFFLLI